MRINLVSLVTKKKKGKGKKEKGKKTKAVVVAGVKRSSASSASSSSGDGGGGGGEGGPANDDNGAAVQKKKKATAQKAKAAAVTAEAEAESAAIAAPVPVPSVLQAASKADLEDVESRLRTGIQLHPRQESLGALGASALADRRALLCTIPFSRDDLQWAGERYAGLLAEGLIQYESYKDVCAKNAQYVRDHGKPGDRVLYYSKGEDERICEGTLVKFSSRTNFRVLPEDDRGLQISVHCRSITLVPSV